MKAGLRCKTNEGMREYFVSVMAPQHLAHLLYSARGSKIDVYTLLSSGDMMIFLKASIQRME